MEEEATATVLAGLKEVVEHKGVFCALYSDRGSHFWLTPKAGEAVDRHRLTQVGRAMRELGVRMIPATHRRRGEIVNRKLSVIVLTNPAIVWAGTMDGHAQSLRTRHVREAVLNGQAQPIGRLPATQVMQLNFVLPLRDQAGLDSFLSEVYDPASP